MMRQLLQLKLNSRPVLVKLLSSFCIIIVLFSSFSMFSYYFFQKNIHDEIITYNETNMANTTRNFEQYFQLLDSVMVNFYLSNDYINNTKSQNMNYAQASGLITDLQRLITNQHLYINNILVYDMRYNTVFDKTRGGSPEQVFNEYFRNPKYTADFWKKEFAGTSNLKMYPAASFKQQSTYSALSDSVQALPYMVKSKVYPDFAILVLIRTDELFSNFHQSINNNFYILDPQGVPLLTNINAEGITLPRVQPGESWIKDGHNYYFYRTGENTGYTYINIVPDEQISSRASFNVTLTVLFIIALIISIVSSIFFSMRFNNPVKEIVASIRQLNTSPGTKHVNEFELIRNSIHSMVKANQEYQDLEEKKALLRYYDYVNRLKNIRGNSSESLEFNSEQRPYRFILFQLNYTVQFFEASIGKEDKTAYYIREYINLTMRNAATNTYTFQIENNQILSIVYEEANHPDLLDSLTQILNVLGEDKEYCFLTLAVSSRYEESADMTKAYDQVLDLLKYRPFHDQPQILNEQRKTLDGFIPATSLIEEINFHLKNGNYELVVQAVSRILQQMEKNQAGTYLFYNMGEEIRSKVNRLLHDTKGSPVPPMPVEQIHTVEQLAQYLEGIIQEATAASKSQKIEQGSIVGFVIHYIEEHFAEDITLDGVAEKLNITGRYLSTHFKEKTGINFIDKVNEVRIEKAKEQLRSSELAIHEIANKTGYYSLSSFNRMFKKFTGVTPSEYRRHASQSQNYI